jgi:hypothetical protein
MQFSIIDKKTGKVYETDGNKIWDDLFYYQKQYSELGITYVAMEAKNIPVQNVIEEVVVEAPKESKKADSVVETPAVVEETVVADPVTE